MRVVVGDPDEATECEIAAGRIGKAADVRPLMAPGELNAAIEALGAVPAPAPLTAYAVRLARATRTHPDVARGVSVRATAGLVRAARARAMLAGRRYPVADDVQALAVPVLAHRMVVHLGSGREPTDVVAELVRRVPVAERTAVR
ncbi:MoxR family ATPase [Streptomyces sp. XD-27]|uniref:AAA family ATPase n=1 Tax=Streptomyces sp. XD-27 TaxID=3062779 RepID=UPI0026F452DD|nr:hypothetical protein [Streptomyces sp. XD-27]WKX73764.1 hypothetical protein Q3Y56_31300 [Streptomyces sp. XD-27]